MKELKQQALNLVDRSGQDQCETEYSKLLGTRQQNENLSIKNDNVQSLFKDGKQKKEQDELDEITDRTPEKK